MLFGGTGQVGSELSRTLPSLGPVVTPRRPDIDLADPDSMIRCIRASEPSLIINAAAYTAVDAAEQARLMKRAGFTSGLLCFLFALFYVGKMFQP